MGVFIAPWNHSWGEKTLYDVLWNNAAIEYYSGSKNTYTDKDRVMILATSNLLNIISPFAFLSNGV